MKFLRGLCLSMILGSLWGVSGIISTYRLNSLESVGILPYGPLPATESVSYSYEGLQQAFDSNVPLKRASEFSKSEFISIFVIFRFASI